MRLQFAKLFVIIILTLLFVAWSTEKLFTDKQNQSNPTIEVEQLFELITSSADQSVLLTGGQVLDITDLAWPEFMIQKLKSMKVVSFANDQGEVYHYRLLEQNSIRVAKIGPLQSANNEKLHLNDWLPLIFYLAFATVLFFWLWPMFKDLSRLIKATDEFSNTRKPIDLNLNKTSLVYPLSSSIVNMSRQIQRFISLQRFLASTVSHDIRTPTSRISFLIEMCSKDNIGETKQKINSNLDEIETLTDDFIELARLEEFHTQLNVQNTRINEWLKELVKKSNQTDEAECELVITDDIVFHHDEKFLSRAIQNLIGNAKKYARTRVRIIVKQIDGIVQIVVEDDGPGINPEEQQKVLGLYQRGKTEQNTGSGYGVGLAFTSVIVGWHNGELSIENSPSLKGARITIRLPRSQ